MRGSWQSGRSPQRENVGQDSDVAEETMSAVVKLAKEIDEPCDIHQPTAECHLIFVVHQERAGYTSSGRAGGARGTEERALTSRTRLSRRRMATWRTPSL